MTIKKYKKIKNNKYLITLENNQELELYEEIILEYKLLLKKEITEKVLNELKKNNSLYDCYYIAIRYIKFKSRSEQEVRANLKSLDFNKNEIDFAINKLIKQGYINDYKYAEDFLHKKILTTLHGPNRIRNDLTNKGIDENIITEVLKNYSYDLQAEKIIKIINKAVNSNKDKGNVYLKRKILNDLYYQGYSEDIIENKIEQYDFPDDSNLKIKEEEKIRKKYQEKYDDIELEYKIKKELIKKGLLEEI